MSTTNLSSTTTSTEARLAELAARLDGYEATRRELFELPRRTNTEHAVRAARLALVSAQITGAWRLIAAHTASDPTVSLLFHRAVVHAEHGARDTARFWRDTAADWQARAERRPTSDAAGALSNWDELGVSA